MNEYGSLGELSDAVRNNGTSIKNPGTDKKNYIFENTGSELIIRNVETDTNVSLFTVNGQLLKTVKATSTAVRFSYSFLKGVYIVTLNQTSFKIIL